MRLNQTHLVTSLPLSLFNFFLLLEWQGGGGGGGDFGECFYLMIPLVFLLGKINTTDLCEKGV